MGWSWITQLGDKALYYSTGGNSSNNIALGCCALYCNCAAHNIALGASSLSINTSGQGNVAIGYYSLKGNTYGNANTSIGCNSLRYNTTGCLNVAVGASALYGNTTGIGNIAQGYRTLFCNTIGHCNIAIGYLAGCVNTTGSNNIIIGTCSVAPTVTSVNTITIGTATYTCQRAPSATWTALSDLRDKINVETIPIGLQFLKEINPVKFTWKIRNTDETHPRYNKPDSGFIAQELLATANKWNVNEWLKVASDSNPDEIYADPGRLLPVTVKAIQELANQVEILESKIKTLQDQITILESKLPPV